ncbi:MAG TPA: HAD-IA family hydrolase [Dissulfurispiraceae bacterium]|nr:HAD-IA family hydrolase [Dissulfurispiraceae bacterium]
MIKAVVFDFGGVIAEEGFRQGLLQIAQNNGIDPDQFFNSAVELIHRPGGYVTGGSGEAAWWNELRALAGIGGSDSELRKIIIERFVIKPEMMGIVEALKSRGYIVAVLSDQTNWLDEIDRRIPFSHVFKYIFNSYYLHKSKRDPSVFRDLCSAMGLKPEEVLFVDDNEGNIERARNRGLDAILFTDVSFFRDVLEAHLAGPTPDQNIYDCIIVGGGPGGLQAAIYLGRYNRQVLLVDRGGGRTTHAVHIENLLGHREISGKEIIALGMEQARAFNVRVVKGLVTSIRKEKDFEVAVGEGNACRAKYVIVSTGGRENIPEIENVGKFFAKSFFTCVDCDGYRTTGKKLVILGNSMQSVRLAFAMKQIYTENVTLVLFFYEPPESYIEEMTREGIRLVKGRPIRIVGKDKMEAVEFADGRSIDCEVVMSNFGFKLNNGFLSGFDLKRDANGFKYITDHNCESSVKGLFIIGPLTGHDQVVIAAGEGAAAAIEINKRLLDL